MCASLIAASAGIATGSDQGKPGGRGPARYVPMRAGFLAEFDVSGRHGSEADTELRDLQGRAVVFAYSHDGITQVVFLYQPDHPEKVMIGCPLTFLRIGPDGFAHREKEYKSAFANSLLIPILFPTWLRATEPGIHDIEEPLVALETVIPTVLKVEMLPDPAGAGWVRTERLAKPSDEHVIPPGRGRISDWDAKYEIAADGTLLLADVKYKMQVSSLGNLVLTISGRLNRAQIRPLSPEEQARIRTDVDVLKTISRDWVTDRVKTRKSVDYLMTHSTGSVMAPHVAFLKQQLESDISRIGEHAAHRVRRTPTTPQTQPLGNQ